MHKNGQITANFKRKLQAGIKTDSDYMIWEMKEQTNQQTKNRIGLYSVLFRRLNEIKKRYRKDIISFPHLFEKLCRNFSISKQECWELLFLLKEFELIELVEGHGVRVVGKI